MLAQGGRDVAGFPLPMPILGQLQHLRQDAAFSCLNEEDEALVEVNLVQLVLLSKGQLGKH